MRTFTERDKVIVAFSKEKGKINLKAKGLSSIKSKLKGHLIPLSLVNIQVAKGRGDLDVITYAQNINSFICVKSDLKKLSLAYWAGEIIDGLTIENEQSSKVFELIHSFFIILEAIDIAEKGDLIMTSFLFNLISLQGHGPKVQACVVCEKNYKKDEDYYYFDLEHGGILCQNCESHKSHSIKISLEQLKVLNALSRLNFKDTLKLKLTEEASKQTKELIESFNRYLFHKEFKAEKFIKDVNAL